MTNKKKKNTVTVSTVSTVTVSIITVTQIKRKDTIRILADLIKCQTYKNIIQWVIVEGSNNKDDALTNGEYIKELIEDNKDVSFAIDYIPYEITKDMKLGNLRNTGNKSCTGDITVCMDDDDYYPPTRVEHVVKKFSESKYLLAGCSDKYLYDYCLKRLYKFKPYGPFHSTNDCMAWKKEYLLNNSHDPNVNCAEEYSFTQKFSQPMIQLDPEHTIISSSHTQNTFNKKEICVTTSIGIYPNAVQLDIEPTEMKNGMDPKIFERYQKLYENDTVSPYDIVYFTGGTSIEWDPEDKSLGGSEQAVVNLASEWYKLGKKVAVYGKIQNKKIDDREGKSKIFPLTLQGVDYFNWKTFSYSASYSTLILWRHAGVNCLLQFPVKTKKLYVDLHDNFYKFRFDYSKYSHKIDKIFFKSDYHLDCYQKQLNVKLDSDKYSIILNGIRTDPFSSPPVSSSFDMHPAASSLAGMLPVASSQPVDVMQRNPYRFCYCSCYTRGLMELLRYVWPMIYANEPRAELHVYYGMNNVNNPQYVQQMLLLLSQPGVMDHGRMPMDMIIREKWMSTFHLYVTDTDQEIDCISIRESLCTGCIPLLSKSGVFAERTGLKFDLDRSNQESYKKIAIGILNLMRNQQFIQYTREQFKNDKTIVSWKDVANQWLDVIKYE